MKNIRILLSAVSMLMLLGCSDDIDTASMTKIFNVTCDTGVTGSLAPDWNVIFPPVLNDPFYVFKGIVKDGQIDCDEETTGYKRISSTLRYDYADSAFAEINSLYTDKTNDTKVYLSPDDDENYALLIWSYTSPNIQSDFFYPKDLIAIKCKSFTRVAKEYSWTIEFSGERPDSLSFVYASSSVNSAKAYWKLSDSYKDKEINLDDTNLIPTGTGSYITKGSYSVGSSSAYGACFAKYGDYYVRVTPRM